MYDTNSALREPVAEDDEDNRVVPRGSTSQKVHTDKMQPKKAQQNVQQVSKKNQAHPSSGDKVKHSLPMPASHNSVVYQIDGRVASSPWLRPKSALSALLGGGSAKVNQWNGGGGKQQAKEAKQHHAEDMRHARPSTAGARPAIATSSSSSSHALGSSGASSSNANPSHIGQQQQPGVKKQGVRLAAAAATSVQQLPRPTTHKHAGSSSTQIGSSTGFSTGEKKSVGGTQSRSPEQVGHELSCEGGASTEQKMPSYVDDGTPPFPPRSCAEKFKSPRDGGKPETDSTEPAVAEPYSQVADVLGRFGATDDERTPQYAMADNTGKTGATSSSDRVAESVERGNVLAGALLTAAASAAAATAAAANQHRPVSAGGGTRAQKSVVAHASSAKTMKHASGVATGSGQGGKVKEVSAVGRSHDRSKKPVAGTATSVGAVATKHAGMLTVPATSGEVVKVASPATASGQPPATSSKVPAATSSKGRSSTEKPNGSMLEAKGGLPTEQHTDRAITKKKHSATTTATATQQQTLLAHSSSNNERKSGPASAQEKTTPTPGVPRHYQNHTRGLKTVLSVITFRRKQTCHFCISPIRLQDSALLSAAPCVRVRYCKNRILIRAVFLPTSSTYQSPLRLQLNC